MPSPSEDRPAPAALTRAFFQRDPATCARELIGVEFHWGSCSGLVVETEAYSEIGDEACHTFFRPGARRFVESHQAGAAYVYFNYGMYWLTNVLTKDPVTGERGFVLLRALQPLAGLDRMRRRRRRDRDRDLCSGPGKLSMALGITGDHHGRDLAPRDAGTGPPRGFFTPAGASPTPRVTADRRIGISRARGLPWRFLAENNPWVSQKPGPGSLPARRDQ